MGDCFYFRKKIQIPDQVVHISISRLRTFNVSTLKVPDRRIKKHLMVLVRLSF